METVRSIKTQLRRGITCETNWTPQQVHYDIILYNQHYQELPDSESLGNLEKDGILWNEDDIYMIMKVNSGRMIDTFDNITLYLRKLCIGLRPMAIREDPNHNYMFAWAESPPLPYTPPPLIAPAATDTEVQTKSPKSPDIACLPEFPNGLDSSLDSSDLGDSKFL